MKRVFKASDSITKRALEATKRALEAKAPDKGPLPGRVVAEVAGAKEGDGAVIKRGRPAGAKTRVKDAGKGTGKKSGGILGEKAKYLKKSELHETQPKVARNATRELSVSSAIGPEAMADWNRQLAELCVETIKGAPKKLLLQKPSDLKLVDDLMRRANGVTGSNGGGDRPGNLVQINFLSDVGKERPENIRVTTSPFPQDVEE